MLITIQNCNNINLGIVKIVENRLNIKYAINGTGKSTISKALSLSIIDRENQTTRLFELTPFNVVGDDSIQPTVTGAESISSVKVFDENYINEFIFQPDELVKGSFDIFIRDAEYETKMDEIEGLVTEIKILFSEDKEIDELISDFNEFSQSFGQATKAKINGSSLLAKALKKGNKVTNIPTEIEIYKDYIQDSNNYKWIKWQLDGNQFIHITDNCPYCVNDILTKKETIRQVGNFYKSNTIENLNKIISIFQKLDKYFSSTTKGVINDFITNVNGYTDDQDTYLQEVKNQVDLLNEKFKRVKNIGFFSLKNVDKVIEELRIYTIQINLYNHLESESTLEKVKNINELIAKLIEKASLLQGKITLQKRHIETLVNQNKEEINSFLRNAGYGYTVDLTEDEKGKHKLKLIHLDIQNEIKDVKSRLSYGERNAFALVLFMFDALKNKADLVVLDDPISSFDKNKKYAILEMLFTKEKFFRNKTVLLLSHDFEPIVDTIYHHSDRFNQPFASFLENNCGTLRETEIKKSDIQTFIQINLANISDNTNVVSKLVYLRRNYEITDARGMAYEIVSNIFHKRSEPTILDDESRREMTPEEITEGIEEIKRHIDDFDYQEVITFVSNDSQMINLYQQVSNNYEKLHVYRIIFDGKDTTLKSNIIQKFINQAFHIENDYIYQLNPAKFQTVPQYVINECDRLLNELVVVN